MPEHTGADSKDLWRTALPLLAERVGHATFDGFLRDAEPLNYDGETFVLGVPNQFAKAWLEERHSGVIGATLAELLQHQEPVRIEMQVSEGLAAPPSSEQLPCPEALPIPPATPSPSPAQTYDQLDPTPLNPRYTFDNFVVADCNRFAHAAGIQVAKSPGKSYNPLFIHSKVGLGKTHLMQAIGHMVQELHSNARVVYVSAENFVNQLITAIRDNRTAEFRSKYRSVDVCLVDDIQFIAEIEGPHSEEAFFHTFNTLYQTNKQVVIASDRAPRHLQLMNERLRSRLEMGIIADLRYPDIETRIAILEKKAHAEGVSMSRQILELIATEVESNIRALEGALLNVCAYVSLNALELTTDAVEQIIAPYRGRSNHHRATLDEIVKYVSEQMSCNTDDMLGPKRSQEIVWPRQVAMYLARELTDNSLAEIGRFFGRRDHTTVMHAYNKVSNLVANDEKVLWLINDMKGALRGE